MSYFEYLGIRETAEQENSEQFSAVTRNSDVLHKVGSVPHHLAGELPIVAAARDYMHANFCDKLSVEEIAREVFMSQYHFSRTFKKYTNYSPYQYLLEIRLQHARKLMLQKGLTIKEITFRSGFSSIDYFSAAFSKKFSVCPSIYKKRLHNK